MFTNSSRGYDSPCVDIFHLVANVWRHEWIARVNVCWGLGGNVCSVALLLNSYRDQIKKPARQRREQNFRAPIPKKVSMKIQIENLEKNCPNFDS